MSPSFAHKLGKMKSNEQLREQLNVDLSDSDCHYESNSREREKLVLVQGKITFLVKVRFNS